MCAETASDLNSEPRAHGAVRVGDPVADVDDAFLLERGRGVERQLLPELAALRSGRPFARVGAGRSPQHGNEPQATAPPIVRLPRLQQVGAPDRLGEAAEAQRGEDPPHFLCDEQEVRLHRLGRGRELRAQLGPLRRDAHRTRV